MSIKIVADSSSDIVSFDLVPFASSPMKIVTDEREFTDVPSADAKEMTSFLKSYKGKSGSACPSVGDYIEAFGDAEEIICITITSALSGSYNSACVARDRYIEEHPDRKVFVFDSLSVGPQMELAIIKMAELSNQGKTFEEVVDGFIEYYKTTDFRFMLKSMTNLVNNGRVSKSSAVLASVLGICVVGSVTKEGTLSSDKKVRGDKKAVREIFDVMKQQGYKGGKVIINHCFNSECADILAKEIKTVWPGADVSIKGTRLLCSYYAEEGGVLVGFEK